MYTDTTKTPAGLVRAPLRAGRALAGHARPAEAGQCTLHYAIPLNPFDHRLPSFLTHTRHHNTTHTQGNPSLPALLAQARAEGRPVALFPEVARSNGEGVLAFPRGLFESLAGQQGQGEQPVRAHVFAFRWVGCCKACVSTLPHCSNINTSHHSTPPPPPPSYSAPKGNAGEGLASLTVGNPLGFLLRLLTSWRTTVLVTYVAAEDAPQLAASSASSSGAAKHPSPASSSSSNVCANPQAWGEEVRALLSAMLGKPKLGVGLDDFVTFGQYWEAIRKGNAAAAGRLADARDKI